jgi:hypothetical protein
MLFSKRKYLKLIHSRSNKLEEELVEIDHSTLYEVLWIYIMICFLGAVLITICHYRHREFDWTN